MSHRPLTRSTVDVRIYKYPLRICQTMHHCGVCDLAISSGQSYYDGGYGRRVHESCAPLSPAPPAAPARARE